MADTLKRFSGPSALTGTSALKCTVPADATWSILNIHAANTTGSPVALRISIGTDAAGTRFISDFSVPGPGLFDWPSAEGILVLNANETIYAQGLGLTLTISGVETK